MNQRRAYCTFPRWAREVLGYDKLETRRRDGLEDRLDSRVQIPQGLDLVLAAPALRYSLYAFLKRDLGYLAP